MAYTHVYLASYCPNWSVLLLFILHVLLSYVFVYPIPQHMAAYCDTWHLLFQRPTGSNLDTHWGPLCCRADRHISFWYTCGTRI